MPDAEKDARRVLVESGMTYSEAVSHELRRRGPRGRMVLQPRLLRVAVPEAQANHGPSARWRTRMSRCPLCELYEMSRGDLIRGEIAKTSSGGVAVRRFHEYMTAVHERHIAQARERIRSLGRLTALMAAIADTEETPSP